nr:hypothetical protein [Nocardia farcinica]
MQRLVAVKISRDKSTEPQTLAQLDHRHIVRVFDQRVLPSSGLRLLYMQYVPGGTLFSVLERLRAHPAQARARCVAPWPARSIPTPIAAGPPARTWPSSSTCAWMRAPAIWSTRRRGARGCGPGRGCIRSWPAPSRFPTRWPSSTATSTTAPSSSTSSTRRPSSASIRSLSPPTGCASCWAWSPPTCSSRTCGRSRAGCGTAGTTTPQRWRRRAATPCGWRSATCSPVSCCGRWPGSWCR